MPETSIAIGSNPLRGAKSWQTSKTNQQLHRAADRWLTPEMYLGLETQVIYCPCGEDADYTGATDWTPAFQAMREEIEELSLDMQWPKTSLYGYRRPQFGVALQPGHRYAVGQGVNLTGLRYQGRPVFNGNGGALVCRYNGGGPVLDLLGSAAWTVRDLNIEAGNDFIPSFGIMVGVNKQNGNCADMTFENVNLDGFFSKAGIYNYGSEIFYMSGSTILNLANNAHGFWIDSRNVVDVAAYSQCEDIQVTPGTQTTTSAHHFERVTIRGSTKSFRLTPSQDGNNLTIGKVILSNAYLTAGSGPAIYVDGPIADLQLDIHAEGAPDQLVLFDGSALTGDMEMVSFTLKEHLMSSKLCAIDFIGTNKLLLDHAHITICDSRGESSGVPAKLFGPGMSKARIAGKIAAKKANDYAAFCNLDRLEYADIDLYPGSGAPPSVSWPLRVHAI